MKKTILAVDDEPMNIELLKAVLMPKGFNVKTSSSGAEALEALQNNCPDVILLDIMMPDMNGYEVCKKIRSDPSLPYIPVIFITAEYKESEDIIHGLDIGGDDYISKPFDSSELMSRIRSVLRIKELIDHLNRTKAELARYVSLSTMEMVDKFTSGKMRKAGETRDVTVLFSDIRGFTTISENMDPEKVFEMLNFNLSKQIQIIEVHQGIIDKMSGDEIMAVFEGPKMVQNALKCAGAVIRAFCGEENCLTEDWIGVGIGINTGSVYVGSIGSETIKDFTVVGNTVNVAARLCGYAQKFQVIFSEFTQKLIQKDDVGYKSAGRVPLKGIRETVEIFELLV